MKTKSANFSCKKMGNKEKKIFRRASALYVITLIMFYSATVAFATGADNAAINALNNFNDLVVLVVKAIGGCIALWGLVQALSSFSSHDSNQRVQGIAGLASGILIFFANEILAYIGINL